MPITLYKKPQYVRGDYNKNNPYANVDPYKGLSYWNHLTDMLGITNYAGQAFQNNELNAQNWESAFKLSLEDREYNSYSNQADEMRKAGINPDFQNPSAGMSELGQNIPNQIPFSSSQNTAFIDFLGNAFNIALSDASGVSNLENISFNQDLSILDKSLDSAKLGFVGNIADALMSDDEKMKDFINNPDTSEIFQDMLMSSSEYKGFHNNFKTKRAKKIFDRYFDDYVHSPEVRTQILDYIKDFNRKQVDTSVGYSEKKVMQSKSAKNSLTEVSQILAKYEYQYLENSLKYKSTKSDKDIQYIERFDPIAASDAANKVNTETAASSEADTNFKSLERGLIKDLKESSDNGNILSTALLSSIVIASKFTASSSQGVHTNTSTGEVFNDASRGITFGF